MSWTFTYQGVTYTCRRAGDFDPDAQRYTCDPDNPSPSPSPSGGGSLLGLALALDPARRTYL